MDKRLQPIDPFITRMEAKRQAEWAARLARKPEVDPTITAAEKPSLFSRAAGWWTILRNIVLNVVGATIFVGVCLLLYDAVMRPTIAIAPISMPNELEAKGYSSEVAAYRLRAALTEIVERAGSKKGGADVAGLGDIPDIVVPNTGLSVETIATQIRKLTGWGSRWHVSGCVTGDSDEQYELRLKILTDKQSHMASAPIKAKDVNELFAAGARQILGDADPYLLAVYFYRNKQPEESLLLAKQIAAQDPGNESSGFWAHNLIGVIYRDRREFYKSLIEYKEANKLELERSLSRTISATISRVLLNRKVNARYSVTHTNIGVVLHDQGKLDLALAEHERAIEFDPDYAIPHCNACVVFTKLEKFEEAAVECKKAIELDPKFALAHNNLGDAFKMQNKLDEAIAEYKKASELDPENPRFQANLARAQEAQSIAPAEARPDEPAPKAENSIGRAK